jgi:hypothetical protein
VADPETCGLSRREQRRLRAPAPGAGGLPARGVAANAYWFQRSAVTFPWPWLFAGWSGRGFALKARLRANLVRNSCRAFWTFCFTPRELGRTARA